MINLRSFRPLSTALAAGVITVSLLLLSCGQQSSGKPTARTPGSVPSVAFVTHLSGEVKFESGGTWKDAALGQFLGPGDRIKTGDDSTAEVQISNHANLLLNSNSTIGIEILEVSPYTVQLDSGALIANVAKLAGGERFRVRSGNSIIAVKGTRFLVSQGEDTRIAVSEGTVALLPTGVDPEDLLKLTEDPHLRSALENVGQKALLIEAGHEVALAASVGETEKRVMNDIAVRLAKDSADKTTQDKAGVAATGRELLSNLLVYVGQKVTQELPQAQNISEKARSDLTAAGPMKMLPVPAEQKAGHFSSAGLASVTIKTDPEDAEIFLGDRSIGKRIFSGLFRKDETVTFVVKKPGYQDQRLQIVFSQNLNQTVTVTLEKEKPAYDPQTFLQAVSSGNTGVVDRYISTGGNPNVRNAAGLPAIAIALGADRASPNRLELSAMPKVLERLLTGGADPNAAFTFGGQQLTPLYLVLASGLSSNRTQADLLETLLKAGADPNIYVQNGNIQVNAVSMTIIVGIERKQVNLDLLDLLLKFGANVNAVMVYQGRIMTPLVASVVVGGEQNYVSVPLIELLIEKGADINGRVNIDGEIGTPLHFAEKYGFKQVATLLKQHGAVR